MPRHIPVLLTFITLLLTTAGVQPALTQETPVSMQLHLHGSLSEGPANMGFHSAQAAAGGVDVIWWTDHDWRVLYHQHVSSFDFESSRLKLGGAITTRLDWLPGSVSAWRPYVSTLPSLARLVTGDANDGVKSLRLRGVSSGAMEWEERSYSFFCSRLRQKRSLASNVSLGIAIKVPRPLVSDAQVFVEVVLSQHPDRLQKLTYVATDFASAPPPTVIPLTCPLNTWQTFVLPVSQDALALLPDGDDNSLQKIRIGVRARNGAEVQAYFDTFEIIHDPGLQGAALLELQEDILQRYDSVTQLVGTEVSYHHPHFTVFCDGLPELLDYDTVDAETYAETTVTQAHDGGCLVAYAHPFGTLENLVSEEEQDERVRTTAAQMLETGAHGADLIEVGYLRRGGCDLEHHLQLWDRLTANGLFLPGIGTSDNHGRVWATTVNPFITWAWAQGTDAPSLLSGLSNGRVYFGDIFQWDGELDLSAAGAVMGGEGVVSSDTTELTIHLTPDHGGEVKLVQGIVQPGTGVEYVRYLDVVDPAMPVVLDTTRSSFVRVELWLDETPVAFSNPLRLVRTE